MRDKKSQGGFFGTLPTIPFNYVDSHLQTWSITPRLSIKNSLFGVPSQILTGIDYYDADLSIRTGRCSRARSRSTSTTCRSRSLAGYWQHTVGLLPTTDFSYGARVQNTMAQCARST